MGASEKCGLREFKRRLVADSFPVFSSVATALEGLAFVQADPIRSPARAQDLILRQRVRGYRVGDLERSFPDLAAEEGFLFAYGFMRREVWSDLRGPRRATLTKLEREVVAAVAKWGEVHPRVLGERLGRGSVKNYWGGRSQLVKRVLEDLHEEGLLRVSRREKGVRLYEMAPAEEGPRALAQERYARLLLTTLRVFGPTSKRFLLSELKALHPLMPKRAQREQVIDDGMASGELTEVEVGGQRYLCMAQSWPSEEVVKRARILTPFDPLVRSRERFEQLWGWSYRFEAYLPAAKRQRGYYAMPVLWIDDVVGWANAKVEGGRLRVNVGYAKKPPRGKPFHVAMEAEVEAMALCLGLESGAWELRGMKSGIIPS